LKFTSINTIPINTSKLTIGGIPVSPTKGIAVCWDTVAINVGVAPAEQYLQKFLSYDSTYGKLALLVWRQRSTFPLSSEYCFFQASASTQFLTVSGVFY
jgi:hypothetical protein